MNVKKGDLAYIKNSAIPENIGMIVEVIQFLGDLQYDIGVRVAWAVKTCSDTYVFKGGNKIKVKAGTTVSCPDMFLRRIAGPSIKIDTETEQPINDEVTA